MATTTPTPIRPTDDLSAKAARLEADLLNAPPPAAAEPVTETDKLAMTGVDIYYGSHRAVRDVEPAGPGERHHRLHRSVGLRQEHRPPLLQPHERPHPERHGRRERSRSTARTSTRPASSRSRSDAGSAWSSSGRTRSRCPSTRTSPTARAGWPDQGPGRPRRDRRALAAPGGHLGRGQGRLPKEVGPLAVRRPAAAAVHRARAGDRARGRPDGRAVLRARPDRDAQDRGADGRAASSYTIVIVTHNMQQAARISDRTGVLHPGHGPRRLPRRDGRDDQHLHQPEGPADRGLRVRSVRMSREETR